MYRENGLTDELIEDKPSTSRHLNRFDHLWHVATDEADTIDFMGRRIEHWSKISDSQGCCIPLCSEPCSHKTTESPELNSIDPPKWLKSTRCSGG